MGFPAPAPFPEKEPCFHRLYVLVFHRRLHLNKEFQGSENIKSRALFFTILLGQCNLTVCTNRQLIPKPGK